jgi:transposase
MNKTLKDREKRRFQAAKYFEEGMAQADVARRLGVSRVSAHRWYHTWVERGPAALSSPGRAGRKPRLSQEQLAQVEQALLEGPLAHGYDTQLWTLARIAEVIEHLTGVRYHPGHVWWLLKDLDWSLQKPKTKAKERDEKAVERWRRQEWPALKKAPGGVEKP